MLTLGKEHESNIHSQFGEDGVLRAICLTLDIERGRSVEFGAWDGTHLSNTAALREAGWEACLIEGDAKRFAVLQQRFGNDPRVVAVHEWVRPSGDHALDAILARHFPGPIDVLSIDIDSDDFQIFESLQNRPRVVVIEFNPTIPPMIDWTNPPGRATGCSLGTLARMAAGKGYDLVHATAANAFFVDGSRNERIRVKTALEAFDWSHTAFVMSSPEGRNWLGSRMNGIGKVVNPWTGNRSAIAMGPPARIRIKHLLRSFLPR